MGDGDSQLEGEPPSPFPPWRPCPRQAEVPAASTGAWRSLPLGTPTRRQRPLVFCGTPRQAWPTSPNWTPGCCCRSPSPSRRASTLQRCGALCQCWAPPPPRPARTIRAPGLWRPPCQASPQARLRSGACHASCVCLQGTFKPFVTHVKLRKDRWAPWVSATCRLRGGQEPGGHCVAQAGRQAGRPQAAPRPWHCRRPGRSGYDVLRRCQVDFELSHENKVGGCRGRGERSCPAPCTLHPGALPSTPVPPKTPPPTHTHTPHSHVAGPRGDCLPSCWERQRVPSRPVRGEGGGRGGARLAAAAAGARQRTRPPQKERKTTLWALARPPCALPCLLQGNHCSGGVRGRDPGNGRVVLAQYEEESAGGGGAACAWRPTAVLRIPRAAHFEDYSGGLGLGKCLDFWFWGRHRGTSLAQERAAQLPCNKSWSSPLPGPGDLSSSPLCLGFAFNQELGKVAIVSQVDAAVWVRAPGQPPPEAEAACPAAKTRFAGCPGCFCKASRPHACTKPRAASSPPAGGRL